MKFFNLKRNKKYILQANSGFTLIETLVAISILLIAVVGPLTISASSLQSSLNVRNQITASYLAEEAIEYIRNIRDTESIKCIYGASFCPPPSASPNTNFLSDLTSPANNPTGIFDLDIINKLPFDESNSDLFNTGVIVSCPINTGCLPLNYNSANGTYSHSSSYSPSQFTRTITLKPINNNDGNNSNSNNDEYQMSVTVKWPSPLPDSSVTLSEDLTNWQ